MSLFLLNAQISSEVAVDVRQMKGDIGIYYDNILVFVLDQYTGKPYFDSIFDDDAKHLIKKGIKLKRCSTLRNTYGEDVFRLDTSQS